MIRSIYFSPDGQLRSDIPDKEFAALIAHPGGLLWVDMDSENENCCKPVLEEVFKFHPLAVDDALEETHVPKLDDWGQYLYMVLYSIQFNPEKEELLDLEELDIFLGNGYLVTYHQRPVPSLDDIWELCQRDLRYLQRGEAFLLYHLADDLVSHYMPTVESLDEIIDEIEDQVLYQPHRQTLERIFTLKRTLLRLRRLLMPQREVFNKLSRGGLPVIEGDEGMYFRDVYDHLVRIYDITESLRDLVGGTLDTYLSAINNRMNEVMKTLTVITTLFMPLSFLTGFFGMNFFQAVAPLDAWTGKTAFLIVMGAFLAVPLGMVLWMRRREWM